MRRGPASATAFFLCFSAVAAELPDMPSTGSTLDLLDRNVYRCEPWEGGLRCHRPGKATDRIEGEPAGGIVLFYRNGVLMRSVVTIDEQQFSAFADKLSPMLGHADQGGEALNAGMGGTFENRYYIWRFDGRAWLLEQFFERITHSGLWIMNDAEFAALMAERERSRVRGVRNL